MVIRRIREHVTAHNWFAVVIDVAIVVVGVFLGTQANNWNQDRIDRADAAEYRQQIIGNIKVNEEDIAARIVYYGQVRRHALAALRALQQRDVKLGEPFLIDAYQASQAWLRGFERTAYDEMVATGVARNVGDSATRAALSGYYVGGRGFDVLALSSTAYRDRLRRIMDLDVQERIRARCNDVMRDLPSGGLSATMPETCAPGLDPAFAARAAKKLQSAPELEEDLTRSIGDIDQKMSMFNRTLRAARAMRAKLEG